MPFDKRRGVVLSVLLASLLLWSADPARAGSLRAVGHFFKDGLNRVVLLRGLNAGIGAKLPPFRGFTYDPEDTSQLELELDPLPGWGVNVIRFLFTWEAYEPSPRVYDANYLGYINSVVNAAWQRGIYVIIDFHQGGYSRRLAGGCGNGFPLWAVFPQATLDPPSHGPLCENWLLTKAISDPDEYLAFGHFFADTFGVRTSYLLALQRVALHFAGHPGVIGYDLINEPWGSEATELLPFYEIAAAAIRAGDPTAIVFVEPQIGVGGGLAQTTLPKPSFGNFAYAPHFYEPAVLFLDFWSGDPAPAVNAFTNMANKATEWNVPLFLGEFGAPAPVPGVISYIDLHYLLLNSTLSSGAQWGYTPFWNPADLDGYNGEDLNVTDDQGSLRPNFRVRPYPQKISGGPTKITATVNPPSIELSWIHVKQTGWTELFAPRVALFGATPVKIEMEGAGLFCSYEASQTKVFCVSSVNGPKRVKVRVCDPLSETCS